MFFFIPFEVLEESLRHVRGLLGTGADNSPIFSWFHLQSKWFGRKRHVLHVLGVLWSCFQRVILPFGKKK